MIKNIDVEIKYNPESKEFCAFIKPALIPEKRRKIENLLSELGFVITGAGTSINQNYSDISFMKKEEYLKKYENKEIFMKFKKKD